MYHRTRMTKSLILMIITLLIGIFVMSATAGITAQANSLKGMTIKVGFFDLDGYHNSYSDDSKSGYGFEYLKEIAKLTGWSFEYVTGSWDSNLKMLQKGEIDILTPALKTSEREENFNFSDMDIGSSQSIITVRKDDPRYSFNDFSNFDGIKVGILSDSIQIEQFKKFQLDNGFSASEIVLYNEQEQLMRALQNGMIDASVMTNLRKLSYEKIVAKFSSTPFYAMTTKSQRGDEIKATLDIALHEIINRNPNYNGALYQKYFGVNANSTLTLTPEEITFLKNKGELKVAFVPTLKPLSYYENGTEKGIDIEIARLIAASLGIKISFVPGDNFKICCDMINDGRADIFFNVSSDYSWSEQNSMNITSPYKTMQYSAITRKNNSKIEIVATPKNYYINQTYVKKNYSSDKIREYLSIPECAAGVMRGEADIAFVDTFIANEICRPVKSSLQANVVSDLTHEQSIGLGITADSMLYIIIDKAVVALNDGEVNAIISNNTILARNPLSFSDFLHQNSVALILIIVGIALLIITLLCLIIFFIKRFSKHIFKLAYIDSLTQIPNYHKFVDDSTRLFSGDNNENKYTIVSLDIRKFSSINETYGRGVGDKVIIHCAKILNRDTPSALLVSRVKSDNFLILLGTADKTQVVEIIEKITLLLATFIENNIEIKIKLDIGIYIVRNNTSITNSIDFAETARKETKRNTQNIFFYDSRFEEKIKMQNDIEERMEQALRDREFQVYYQPKFDMTTSEIVGAEALVRWASKTRGFLSPGDFLPIFEKNGFITELDFFVLNEVCVLIKNWITSGKKTMPISVNQSRLHFLSENYHERLSQIMTANTVPYELIELEITETAFSDSEYIFSAVKGLQNSGFRLSVDDFGSGYSSLNLINAVRLDVLKIDKSFLTDSQGSTRSKTIIKKVVEMANDLEMEVICEGVETTDQVEFLLSVGCHLAQGYLFARPMSEIDFLKRYQDCCDKNLAT